MFNCQVCGKTTKRHQKVIWKNFYRPQTYHNIVKVKTKEEEFNIPTKDVYEQKTSKGIEISKQLMCCGLECVTNATK